MSYRLEASFAHCQTVTRRTAGNFYYSFLVLPRAKRRAMCALYAFLRRTDDLGDNRHPTAVRRAALGRWRQSLDRALEGEFDGPVFPAIAETVIHYRLPPAWLHAAIDGVEMDLDHREYETFGELAEYCYKVAGVVGLSCIQVWGFRGDEAPDLACTCGIAFQLTNILRDLKEDAAAGRVYLPQEDLRQFGYTAEALRDGRRDGAFRSLMRFEIARAEHYYREGARLERCLNADGRAVFGAMTAIYRGLLEEIKRLDGDVFTSPVRLSTWRKLRIAGRWLLSRHASSTGRSAWRRSAVRGLIRANPERSVSRR